MNARRIPIIEAKVTPRIIFVERISELIGKTPTTIRTCSTNSKYAHLIPRPFKMPHSNRLCWYEHEVFAWIEKHKPASPELKRPRGRPTKVEQLERDRWLSSQPTGTQNG